VVAGFSLPRVALRAASRATGRAIEGKPAIKNGKAMACERRTAPPGARHADAHATAV